MTVKVFGWICNTGDRSHHIVWIREDEHLDWLEFAECNQESFCDNDGQTLRCTLVLRSYKEAHAMGITFFLKKDWYN